MSLTLAPQVTATPTERGMVLLDERSGRYWQINGSGATALRMLLDGRTVEEAADTVRGQSTVPAERAVADVHALLRTLHEARLVVT